uniref:Gag protein n=1 Tax=Wuchereria bancrofti TaxID=6293 RepID=A0AAF5Q6T7_WUCBA
MSASIIVRTKPIKANLEELLDEIRQIDLTPLDQKSPTELLCQQYETRKKKEEKYEEMATDDRGILNLINTGTDTIITLSMYKDDTDLTECRPVENLPQLSLPTFSGDPKTWREFWSNFETSLVRGYDRAPENYDIIRELLVEKFGRVSTIRKLLYNEFISTKRSDRNWKTIVEEMVRVLRQLEAIGENVEQPIIETIITKLHTEPGLSTIRR